MHPQTRRALTPSGACMCRQVFCHVQRWRDCRGLRQRLLNDGSVESLSADSEELNCLHSKLARFHDDRPGYTTKLLFPA